MNSFYPQVFSHRAIAPFTSAYEYILSPLPYKCNSKASWLAFLSLYLIHLRLQTGFPVCVWGRGCISGPPQSSQSSQSPPPSSQLPDMCWDWGSQRRQLNPLVMFNWSPCLCFLPLLFKVSRKDETSLNYRGFSFLLSLCCCNVVSAGFEQD